MTSFLFYALYAAIAGVVIVLILGVVNLARTDDEQVSRSNKLMRLRVLMQFIAIALMVGLGLALGAINFG